MMTRYALILLLAALTIAAAADHQPDTASDYRHEWVRMGAGVVDAVCCTTCANQTGTAKYFSIVSFPAPACGPS